MSFDIINGGRRTDSFSWDVFGVIRFSLRAVLSISHLLALCLASIIGSMLLNFFLGDLCLCRPAVNVDGEISFNAILTDFFGVLCRPFRSSPPC